MGNLEGKRPGVLEAKGRRGGSNRSGRMSRRMLSVMIR